MFVMELNPYSARTNGQEIVGTFYQILANYNCSLGSHYSEFIALICRNLERNLSIHRLDFVNEKLISKKSVVNL